MGRNKLAPNQGGLMNYLLNFGIAVGWLLKWIIKLLKAPLNGKGKK